MLRRVQRAALTARWSGLRACELGGVGWRWPSAALQAAVTTSTAACHGQEAVHPAAAAADARVAEPSLSSVSWTLSEACDAAIVALENTEGPGAAQSAQEAAAAFLDAVGDPRVVAATPVTVSTLVVALRVGVAAVNVLRSSATSKSVVARGRRGLEALFEAHWPLLEAAEDRVDVFVAASRLRVGTADAVTGLFSMCLVPSVSVPPTQQPRPDRGVDHPAKQPAGLTDAQLKAATRRHGRMLVELVEAASFAFARHRLDAPAMTPLLAPIRAGHKLTHAQALRLVTSLARLRPGRSQSDTMRFYTQHLAPAIAAVGRSRGGEGGDIDDAVAMAETEDEGLPADAKKSCKWIVDAVYTVAHGVDVDADFCVAAMDAATGRAHELSARDVAEVCRALNSLHRHRSLAHLNRALDGRTRRLLPQLSKRAEVLVGAFSRSQARDVLTCFQTRKVRAGFVFSRLCKASEL